MLANQQAEWSPIADQLIRRIPLKSYIGVNKPNYGWSSRVANLDDLGRFDTTCLNTRIYTNLISVDVDDRLAALNCFDLADYDSRLLPNLVVENRHGDLGARAGHAHALYFLDEPFVRSGSKAEGVIRDVRQRLNLVIPNADPNYTNCWAKNPLNDRWKVTVLREQPHDIKDLWQILPSLQTSQFVGRAMNTGNFSFKAGSRNSDVFNAVRDWAYGEWPKYGSELAWHAAVYAYAALLNTQCSPPLQDREIKMIAKSVAGFCLAKQPYRRRSSPSWDLGVLDLKGKGISQRDACVAGAEHSHQVRINKTQLLLRDTRVLHPSASQVQVAKLTGLNRKTVMLHWSQSFSSVVGPDLSPDNSPINSLGLSHTTTLLNSITDTPPAETELNKITMKEVTGTCPACDTSEPAVEFSSEAVRCKACKALLARQRYAADTAYRERQQAAARACNRRRRSKRVAE